MQKDNMEQRSAEELTTEELEHVSAAAAPPNWYSPIDDTKSYPGGGRSSYAEPDKD